MKIADMHYDFKFKLNKLDSNAYRNLKIQEIDWILNEAQEVFIKMVAEPRYASELGFESSQRTTDDIRSLVKEEFLDSAGIIPTQVDSFRYIAAYPTDYMYFIRAYIKCTKGGCTAVCRARVKQHDDMHRESPFDSSSFEWQEINVEFSSTGTIIYSDGTFVPTNYHYSYIRQPLYMNNSAAISGGYCLPDGTVCFTTNQDCELPDSAHREVVDLAVLIATGALQIPDYQIKLAKLTLTK